MELSLAVNNSLLALHQLGIYCTEPFRIPFAGRLHVCCFDKTGTLTLSELIVEGVATQNAAPSDGPDGVYGVAEAADAPLAAGYVLGACHQLVSSGGKLLGDPMERAALQAAGWVYTPDGTAHRAAPLQPAELGSAVCDALPPRALCQPRLRILRRFPFSSELKRSSAVVIADVTVVGASLRPEQTAALHAAAMSSGAAGALVLAKGSPEAVRPLLLHVPPGYDETYLHYASSGKRVLALASKRLHPSGETLQRWMAAGRGGGDGGGDGSMPSREEAEGGLIFCGFLVLHCPPRPESADMLSALSTSGHTLQMLTGDSLLTATHSAHALGLATKPALLLELDEATGEAQAQGAGNGGGDGFCSPPPRTRSPQGTPRGTPRGTPVACRTPIEKYISDRMAKAPPLRPKEASGLAGTGAPGGPPLRWRAWMAEADAPPPPPLTDLSRRTFRELARSYDLCVGGDGFSALLDAGALPAALPYLRVLARMAPAQKEVALATLRDCGLVTLMCGDGTNDVGALKQSAVSVALVSTSLVAPPPPPRAVPEAEPAAAASASGMRQRKGGKGSSLTPRERHMEKQRARAAERQERAPIGPTVPSVKLGDASIAAAFTARSASPSSCVDVITQGRCTLVTTTQMFKILSLNCLISAYALSVLHHKGFRMSDTQATTTGLATAALFLFVSFSQPLPKLAPLRPPPSALAPSVLLSVLGQFAMHLYTTIHGFHLAVEASASEPVPEADADFEPTLTNTVLFLLSTAMLLSTFAVNYTGRPYMASLASNKGLAFTLAAGAALVLLLTTGALPALEEYLELVPLPTHANSSSGDASGDGDGAGLGSDLLSLMALDFVVCFVTEKGTARLFRY